MPWNIWPYKEGNLSFVGSGGHAAGAQGGGCCLPTTKRRTPPLYHTCAFAPNHIIAKSCFWYLVSQRKKMKKSSGEIVCCGQVFEKCPLRAKQSSGYATMRSGTHNMHWEYRDLTTGVPPPGATETPPSRTTPLPTHSRS